jgi:hypothetical protein
MNNSIKISEIPRGRFGNALFRFMATCLFSLKYKNYNITRIQYDDTIPIYYIIIIDDTNFLNIIENLITLDNNKIYFFQGFFQFDIYKKYRDEILNYMNEHKDDELYCTGYINGEKIYVKDILSALNPPPPPQPSYEVIIHVRLEDFIFNKHVIHPEILNFVIKNVINKCNENIRIISNQPTTLLEYEYLEYFYKKYKINFITNNVLTDFSIMCNAKTLLCSHSTISWCAALLSKQITEVLIPDQVLNSHQKFSLPHEKTILYPNKVCDEKELTAFFIESRKTVGKP